MQYDFKIQTPFEFWSHIFNFSYQLVLETEASNCSTIKKNHLDFVVRFRHFYRTLITRSVLQRESPYKKPSTLKWVLITSLIQNFTYPHQTCSHSFLDINQQIPSATLPVSFMSLGNLKVDSSPIRLYFYLASQGGICHYSASSIASLDLSLSLPYGHWWPLSFKFFIWFISHCIRIV